MKSDSIKAQILCCALLLTLILYPSAVSAAYVTSGLVLNMDASDPGNEPWDIWQPVVGPSNGGVVLDWTGEHLPTLLGEPSGTPGSYWWFYHFTSGDLVGGQVGELGTDVNFDYTDDFTIELWFRATEAPPEGAGRGVIFSSQENTNGYRFGVRGMGSTYYMEFVMRDKKGDYWRQFTGAGPTFTYGDSQWNHIILTYDGSLVGNPVISQYKNGVFNNGGVAGCSDQSGNGACAFPLAETDFVPQASYAGIGARSFYSGTMFLRGDVSIVRVYNRILSSAEVLQNYNEGMTEKIVLPPTAPEPNETNYPAYDPNYSVFTAGPHREKMKRLGVERRVTIARDPAQYLCRTDVTETDSGKLLCIFIESDSHLGTYGNIVKTESTDGGATWSPYEMLHAGNHSCPRLQKLDDGTLVISCANPPDDKSLSVALLLWSYDEGQTWSEQYLWGLIPGEPERVHVLSNGDMILPNQRLRLAGSPNHELEAVIHRSYDMGATWNRPGHLVASGHKKNFNEAVLVELPNQRLWELLVMGFMTFSDDFGYTWSPPVLAPLSPARPCAEVLPSGQVLVTHRNNAVGEPGYVAWLGDPEQLYEDKVFPVYGRAMEEDRIRLESDRLVMESGNGYWPATQYILPMLSEVNDHIIFEARMRCVSANTNGCSITAGVPVKFDPANNKVSLYKDPAINFTVNDMTQFHDYKIERDNMQLKMWCDGQLKVDTDISHISSAENERYVFFGNYNEHMEWATYWFGNNAARSEWQSISVQVDAATFPSYKWSWDASSGVYPDQYRRDRCIMLELEGSNKNSDVGYGGWTRMSDGTIFVVNYTRGDGQDMAVQTQPFIRGYWLYEDDFDIPVPPEPNLLLHLDANDPGNSPASQWEPVVGDGGTLIDLGGLGNLPSLQSENNRDFYHFTIEPGGGGQVAGFDSELLFDYDDDFTIEAWFRPQQNLGIGRMHIFGDQTDNATGYRLTAREVTQGKFRIELTMRDNNGSAENKARYQVSTGDIFNMNQWLHVIATYEGTDGGLPVMKVYSNCIDEPLSSQSDSWVPPAGQRDFIPASADNISAAARVDAGAVSSDIGRMWFGGDIAVVRVYNKILEHSDVLEKYQQNAASFGMDVCWGYPCQPNGDASGDGFITSTDVWILVNAWNNGYEACADFNHDGFITSTDVDILINGWNAGGCP